MRALAIVAALACLLAPAPHELEPALRLVNVAADAGLSSFHHVGGGTPDKRYIPEVMSGGVCAADFDNDGWTDVVLVNGGSFETAAHRAPPPAHGIFRNVNGKFTDVTASTGIQNAGWGMGCATADVDGDGNVDLLITNFLGPLQLWRNDGNWHFVDVAASEGIVGEPGGWYTGATFGDYDGDGRLDLAVSGYVRLDPDHLPDPDRTPECRHRGLVVNCGPRGLPGERDLLFHNEGNSRFRRVLEIDPKAYYGLGAAFLPLDAQGSLALYIANDSTPNLLYRFRDGHLTEEAMEAGLALSEEGHEQAGMGIAWGDANGDGRVDLYVTNFVDDYNTLYENLGRGLFEDATRQARLVQPTWLYMGWGTAFADFDNDGQDELIVANGHVYPQVDTLHLPSTWRMPVQVFVSRPDHTFEPLARTAIAGPDAVGRGLAVADFWNDGSIGAVINNLDGTPSLYRAAAGDRGHWIELSLEGARIRDATGALITCRRNGGQSLSIVASGGSYLSSNDRRVHVGLGAAANVQCRIRWSGGLQQDLAPLAAGHLYVVHEGKEASRLH
jgi:enediyne biosynthesis protein E4